MGVEKEKVRRVLLVVNKWNREIGIMRLIRKQIRMADPLARVCIVKYTHRFFFRFALSYKPTAILTFPFTGEGLSRPFYILKAVFGALVVCMRQEGVIDLNDEDNVKWAVGYDKYGDKLVDYEVFWGAQTARVIGAKLLAEKKLSSTRRVKYYGYIRLESVLSQEISEMQLLPSDVDRAITVMGDKKGVLFLTGFHLADYSRDDLFGAGDLDAYNRLDELLQAVARARQYRLCYIEEIVRCSKKYPEQIFIIKKHPLERKAIYDQYFFGCHNVILLREDFDLSLLMEFVALMFHYGSTAVVDAYLAGVPTVYVSPDEKILWFSDMGFPNNRSIVCDEIVPTVENYLAGLLPDVDSALVKSVLLDYYNIGSGGEYMPSKNVASLLLSNGGAQSVSFTDSYLFRAIVSKVFSVLKSLLFWARRLLLRQLKSGRMSFRTN